MPEVMYTGTGSPLRRLLGALQFFFDADAQGGGPKAQAALLVVHEEFENLKAYLSDPERMVSQEHR